jgi:polysaccharide pyruvyl transferase CsaB
MSARTGPTLLIGGAYGHANAGDEAVLATMLRDLRARRPDLRLVVVSGDPEHTATTYGVRAIATNDVVALVDAAQAADAVLLGGWFHDHGGCPSESLLTRAHAHVPLLAAFPLLAGLTGRPCMLYGVGVGPLLTAEGGRLTRGAFEQASVATVRDDESVEVLRELGLKDSEVQVTADPAFGLSVDAVAGRKVLSDLGVDPKRPCVAVCLRPWTIGVSPAWPERMAAVLDAFVTQTGAGLVFVPFHTLPYETTDDVAAAERVVAAMRARSRAAIVRAALGPEVVAGIVGACDLVVGMRLHAVIFAAIGGVAAVGLVYDPKVASVMRRLGLEEYAVAPDDADALARRMAQAWGRREEIGAELARRVVGLRAQAAENADLAVSLLDATRRRPARMPEAEWLAGFVLAQTRKLAEQHAVAERLAAEGAARSEEFTARAGEVEALRRQMAVLSAQVSALTGSVGWRLVEAVRGVRERLAPRDTRRGRLVRGGLGALATLAEQGVGRSLAAGRRRTGQWLERRRHEARLARILAKHRGRRAVVFMPMVDWGWMVQRPQQLARALAARGCLVFYVTGQMRTDRVDGVAEVGEALYLCADFTLLRRIANPVVISFNVDHLGALSQFRQPFVIYDVLDDLEVTVAGGVTDEKLAVHARLLGGAGLVTVTSRRLLEDAQRVRPDALRVPNACDPVHFAPAAGRAVPGELAELRAAGGPIAGYYGALAAWFDYELLAAVAARLPHWWFVLIGPDYDGTVARLPARGNVRWLGLKEYAALPGYLQAFDVAMIPFVINDITRATSPVKLFEYMAGDRPIVTTPLEEARRYASVEIADGAEAFAAALQRAYARRDDPVARRVRLAERDANTWRARAEAILEGIALREAAPRDVAVVLAGVPTDDSGGGHRPAQLTLELLARGWRVVYVHKFAKWEHGELRLAFDHPRLERCALDEFEVAPYLDPAPGAATATGRTSGRLLVLVESPHPGFEGAIAALRSRGARVVYDLIDDWGGGLGRGWYDEAAEGRIAAVSDVLVASSTNLVAGLRGRTGRAVSLIPNAVNARIFDVTVSYARPADLPAGRPQIMYVGALWGQWFDWELLRRVAEAYPSGAVTLIGDYRGQCPYPPPRNMFFLGLKAHRELPRYLAHADVALIPFAMTRLTEAMSHLKVFEYVAMGVPVVATPSVELTDLPYVHLAGDAEEFVAAVGRAAEDPVDQAVTTAFTGANTWQARVDTLLATVFP